MNTLVVLTVLFSIAYSVPVEEQEQFVDVTEDTLGNYKLLYKTNEASKSEHRNEDGSVSGAYSFLDPSGHLQTIEYTAGVQGFRPVGPSVPFSQTEIPVPVMDTPEVVKARAEHLAVVNAIKEQRVSPKVARKIITEFTVPEFLVALAKAINSNVPLVFTQNIPEIPDPKVEYLDAYKYAVGDT